MLPRADLNNPARPLASLEAPTPVLSSTDARQEVYHRLLQIGIGKQLQAEVLSRFDDGSFLVKVDDAAARMSLPDGTRVGDKIPMALVAKEPRPAFLLLQAEGSSTASLSSAGRLIDQVLQAARQAGAPTAIQETTPLLSVSSAALDTTQLAATLQDSLELSGLFYESHVEEWAAGRRSLTDLQREPQAQLPSHGKNGLPATSGDGTAADLQRLAGNLRALGEGAQHLADLLQAARQHLAGSAMTDADVIVQAQTAAAPQIDPEAARLMHLQLNTLETRQILWRGELWPGQPMEWDVSEDNGGRDQASGDPAQNSWTSTVRFRLPTLGDIDATVRLVGERVQVRVETASEDTATMLRAQGGQLADALAAAGSPLDALLVKRNEVP